MSKEIGPDSRDTLESQANLFDSWLDVSHNKLLTVLVTVNDLALAVRVFLYDFPWVFGVLVKNGNTLR